MGRHGRCAHRLHPTPSCNNRQFRWRAGRAEGLSTVGQPALHAHSGPSGPRLVWEGYPTSRLFGPRLHVGWVTVVATLLRTMAEYAHRDPQAVTDGEERRERHARKTNSNAAAASACKRDGRRRGGHAQSHTRARSGSYEVFPAVMLGKLLELEKQVVVANCACEQSRAERSLVAELRSHTRCGAGGRRYRKSCRRGR